MGKTWNTVVASDAPRGDVANPTIAVNREGVVALTWNDRRDDPNGRCWQLYAAISIDGGEHFLPAQRLSRRPTCTNESRNWETFGTSLNSDQSGQYLAHFQTGATIPARFPNGGDTQGLVARLRTATSTTVAGSAVAGAEPRGMEDVTRDIRFRVTATHLDFTARTYTVTLQIENQGARSLRGPLHAVMLHFLNSFDNGLGLKNLAAANADGGGRGVGLRGSGRRARARCA